MTELSDIVRRIHQSDVRVMLVVTGGGSGAVAELLKRPGASRTVLEALVPYCPSALVDFLRSRPERFCDRRAACAMAMTAYQRADDLRKQELAGGDGRELFEVAGVSCTASLVSDQPKRGAHRMHVAYQSTRETVCYSLELLKDRRSRTEEEAIATQLVINTVAEVVGVAERVELPLLPTEKFECQRTVAPAEWQALLTGKLTRVRIATGMSTDSALQPRAIFPGAFNPWHEGHRQIVELAQQKLGTTVELEISLENVDKPWLDFAEIEHRLHGLREYPVWLTRAPTFVQKAELFHGATFIVGADTIRRIADPRYYGGSTERCSAAIAHLAQLGCRFLVFGRLQNDGFATLAELPLPPELRALCEGLSIDDFRVDISSTELRSAKKGD